MMIELIKCHGSGNDFLLIDEMEKDYGFSEEGRRELAIALCNREKSLGADGILYILQSSKADATMRVFNSDGSEASMCGNGLRCAARYVCEKLGVEQALIETMKADLQVRKEAEIYPGIPTYQVEISPVSFKLSDLPLNLDRDTLIQEKLPELSNELMFTALAVPNPHLVALVSREHLESGMQKELSEKVNRPNELFPDGVNVSFIRKVGDREIYVRTFERGVGFTNACGTAMSASSLVTCLTGDNAFEEAISVYNNGGMVQCVVHKQGDTYTIDLIGNATYLYKAAIDRDSYQVVDMQEFSEEESYQKLQEHARAMIA
jgi:diaminopimelate epimerase